MPKIQSIEASRSVEPHHEGVMSAESIFREATTPDKRIETFRKEFAPKNIEANKPVQVADDDENEWYFISYDPADGEVSVGVKGENPGKFSQIKEVKLLEFLMLNPKLAPNDKELKLPLSFFLGKWNDLSGETPDDMLEDEDGLKTEVFDAIRARRGVDLPKDQLTLVSMADGKRIAKELREVLPKSKVESINNTRAQKRNRLFTESQPTGQEAAAA